MIQEIPKLVSDLIDAWNTHDISRAVALYAPEYEGRDVGEAQPAYGPGGVHQSLEKYFYAFPDLYFTLEDLIMQGDRFVLHWKAQGTHLGKFMNIPATGRLVTVQGVTILETEGNLAKRGWFIWDVAGLLRDIGLLPDL